MLVSAIVQTRHVRLLRAERHRHVPAALTAVTDATAVTVSESTGSIPIFHRGRIITEIQKPGSRGDKSRLHLHKHRRYDL